MPNEIKHSKTIFWTSRAGIVLQIVAVLLPSGLLINSGRLLLVGLLMSVLLSGAALKLQKKKWSDVGLCAPPGLKLLFSRVAIFTIALVPFSYLLRRVVISMIHSGPNLKEFETIQGNAGALLIGLVIVWVFAAFAEEMFFRGFLMNSFYNLLPTRFNERSKWIVSLFITSLFVGLGHAYQGIAGVILTGIIGLIFGIIYLSNKKNLWPGILTHGLYDTVAFILLFFGFSFDQWFK